MHSMYGMCEGLSKESFMISTNPSLSKGEYFEFDAGLIVREYEFILG